MENGLSVDEKVGSLFQSDTLIPAQYFETLRSKAQLEPEKDLMLAVLKDAVTCFQKYVAARIGKRKRMFRDAEEWVLEEEKDWLFSFNNICGALGFDPQYIRKGLVRWKEERLAGKNTARLKHSRRELWRQTQN